MKKTRTRFAPSPTGYIHIGNIRSAIYPFLIARQAGGQFILRIDFILTGTKVLSKVALSLRMSSPKEKIFT